MAGIDEEDEWTVNLISGPVDAPTIPGHYQCLLLNCFWNWTMTSLAEIVQLICRPFNPRWNKMNKRSKLYSGQWLLAHLLVWNTWINWFGTKLANPERSARCPQCADKQRTPCVRDTETHPRPEKMTSQYANIHFEHPVPHIYGQLVHI